MIIGIGYAYKRKNKRRLKSAFPQDTGYFITNNGTIFSDKNMATNLRIPFEKYVEIILACGAVYTKEDGYYFKKKEQIEAAIIALKLISGV